MAKIDLIINNGFKWFNKDNVFVKGFLFDSNNEYFEKEKLVSYFENVKTKEDLLNKISNANGLLTACIKLSENEILIANDIIRAFPLFYTNQNNILHISDSVSEILKSIKEPLLSPLSKNELLASSFVTGSNTLVKSISVTQSGQITEFNNSEISSEFYFNYYTSEENLASYETQRNQLQSNLDKTSERLVESLDGRKAIIPLSGGFDSRYIACKLKELGYTNVFCFSYGKLNNNQERVTSQKVAKELGFDWEFIEYNEKTVGNYIKDEEFTAFCEQFSQFSTTPMFHDYFALKHFKKNKIISDNSVFIPGHSGDFLGGSQLYKNGNIKKEASLKKIAKSIIKERFLLTKLSSESEKEIISKIYSQLLQESKKDKSAYAYSIFEDWEIKENLSKYIANSAHIYDFFGYEYRLPFWDNELVNYCKTIPYKYKFGKILYDEVLRSTFKKFDVDFDEGKLLSPKEFKNYQIRKKIKTLIPNKILKKINPETDPLNYDFAQSAMKEELKKNKNFSENKLNSGNSIFTYWYINEIEKVLKSNKK
ncbi:MAG: asparagine synthase [Bacteroidales bacterium]|nr:asparagine synthase [Bacteroidales bacterium]